MKKIKSKIVIFTIGVAFLFASCLNENDNAIESSRDIAYITTINNTVCAATSSGYITSPAILDLKQKECYIVGYRITNAGANGIYTADAMVNVSGDPLPQTTLRAGSPILTAEQGLAVKELSIPVFAATSYMGDRWLFNYTASTKEKEEIISYFYYDKDNQVDKDGKNIADDNKVIIDILFQQPEVLGTNDIQDRKFLTVGNLENLRTLYTPDFSKKNENNVAVLIQFRYRKYVNESKPSEESFLGTWSTNGHGRVYYMYFEEKK